MTAPCNWEIRTSCCSEWATFSAELQDEATAWATEILWALSGRQFGQCAVSVRPCGRAWGQTYRTYGVWTDGWNTSSAIGPNWVPYIDAGGAWRNCGCAGLCSCAARSEVWLPGPIRSPGITQVRVNNVIVPPADYRLDMGQDGQYWLVGQNGRIWPDCQSFDNPGNSPDDTFVVDYPRGSRLPEGGKIAAGELACQYAIACTGGECALSAVATQVTRDGVSYTIINTVDAVKDGLTPIPSVNLWIQSVNPKRRQGRPRVWSPDVLYPRQTVS